MNGALGKWWPFIVAMAGLVASFTTLQVQVNDLRTIVNSSFIGDYATTKAEVNGLRRDFERLQIDLGQLERTLSRIQRDDIRSNRNPRR